MLQFDHRHKAIVITAKDYDKFVVWAVSNNVSFQDVKTEDDANTIYRGLPSVEEEWEPSGDWDSSGC